MYNEKIIYCYIKVSGIPSANKLIKTIRYPHVKISIDDFTYIKFVFYIDNQAEPITIEE